ncbi:5-formyltetrahydrofolate cyclo-ligase [Amycolatopsis thermophila]|uniref:5-formyltetrahydrofolate cyclo-ligase n=1 Tax=Amycolatopsis thermophila TaxID=206084 RepID=A0ABU0EUW9_9PSEU|nr:5-formyltetrahydrofolate cyclo-ligase [Amycolatopsis thermophila]MDQ0379076.1 5-formyltetrahydrofolate cyclo-ligase [Amycolatopsis thermophila]
MGAQRNDEVTKAEWRAKLSAARAAVSVQQRVAEAGALAQAVSVMSLPDTVCCYVPFGTEPGSTSLLDLLRRRGARVLLPAIPTEPGPLDWAEYTGTASLSPGRFRYILEPTGPLLGPDALSRAGLVLLPALAVDHRGVRLGRGAGHYDRSLVHAAPDAELVAVVRDDELVEHLPSEDHDVLMTGALTPGRGHVRLPL